MQLRIRCVTGIALHFVPMPAIRSIRDCINSTSPDLIHITVVFLLLGKPSKLLSYHLLIVYTVKGKGQAKSSHLFSVTSACFPALVSLSMGLPLFFCRLLTPSRKYNENIKFAKGFS